MYPRRQLPFLQQLLSEFPAVAILGPRQVGKTTLALALTKQLPTMQYLDLESPADAAKLADPAAYFAAHAERLLVIDEVQRAPQLFATLRGVIDQRRRAGQRSGQFLLLGSATGALLAQSAESLAGRIAYLELPPLITVEVPAAQSLALWLRGGFPESFMAASDAASLRWRQQFIATYLERDIPQLGPRIPAETLRRLWTMLAHEQGQMLNAAKLAASLAVSGQTVARYIDLLCDLMLVRRLRPWAANEGKRLVRTPKVYVRDSGLAHALLGLGDLDALLGHPVVGGSWEGWVIENLLAVAPPATQAFFYRSSAGAEIDLLLELPQGQRWAIEIKRSSAPTVSRGFHLAAADLEATARYVVHAGADSYPLPHGVLAVTLADLQRALIELPAT
ncbi:putative AAA+ superfamily ATPase [Paucibacter oligotrophus]|uniref:Putative AAA+ superfamily ATPase n=1 Tax=Roseateles oligotrophus TaxID=1769250 RepID=A0A840LB78_9BURK|nr:ATP-binding protein [Roseateles oligotrophus]MBB4843369.1 putative AAA+ superfamily ATPase [Roseateles oligotrophus]